MKFCPAALLNLVESNKAQYIIEPYLLTVNAKLELINEIPQSHVRYKNFGFDN